MSQRAEPTAISTHGNPGTTYFHFGRLEELCLDTESASCARQRIVRDDTEIGGPGHGKLECVQRAQVDLESGDPVCVRQKVESLERKLGVELRLDTAGKILAAFKRVMACLVKLVIQFSK